MKYREGFSSATEHQLENETIKLLKFGSATLTDTGPDGAVAMSSANGLVGTGFASWYQLQPRAGF